MHKYRPRIHVIPAEEYNMFSMKKGTFYTFTFPETEFMAVTAYQNPRVSCGLHLNCIDCQKRQGREGRREGRKEGKKEGGRKGGREGRKEGRREGGKEGRRERRIH